ncbi:hypothetical protein NEOLEDRAFT_658114 [Neolentinus lepideus HHB14362 ss-1]|uniref:Large ribosomal subunit protein uL30m n=1 Tax=Neolentinus lepideus HHB14362 ss-1 TaxID=1314782 RepID=A0A165QG01_9AGAM|nr:hypothetical protein NEOLEDRAFT_658114 [Neolentinus lepideus HHB14362 ss-1]
MPSPAIAARPLVRKAAPSVCCNRSTSRHLATTTNSPASLSSQPETTHYRITLRRSAIALGHAKQATLIALGLRRRFQTVYHTHTPDIAGKILAVKELVEVQNVRRDEVRTKEEMTRERRATRGFEVVERRVGVRL